MASKINLSARIDIDLDIVRSEFESLSRLESPVTHAQSVIPSDQHDVDWIDFRSEWSDVIDRLELLDQAYSTGAMKSLQAEKYEALWPLLGASLPLLHDFSLRLPAAVIQQRVTIRQERHGAMSPAG